MITHSTFPMHTRTKSLGQLNVPGIDEELEVRQLTGRKGTPVLYVLRKEWKAVKPGDEITPVAEIHIRNDGAVIPYIQTAYHEDLPRVDFDYVKAALSLLAEKS